MHRLTASWILPIAEKGLHNGSIVIDKGRIVAVGTRESMARRFPASNEVVLPGALIPPLINCHHHLELSNFRAEYETTTAGRMVEWITTLIRKRDEKIPDSERNSAIRQEIQAQYEDGVALVADIGNSVYSITPSLSETAPEILFMLEMMAPNRHLLEKSLGLLDKMEQQAWVTAHGVCSTPPQLIVKIKQRCQEHRQLFSIHTAESLEETDFVQKRQGPYRELIQKRGGDLELFPFKGGDYGSPVEYLQKLDVLDQKTLLVHCVHINDTDLKLIAESEARVCLCPGSNRFLGVGITPVEKILIHGIVVGIGTDSAASNPHTSIWKEMGHIAEDHSDVPAFEILRMATVGGAAALGYTEDFGGLTPGSKGIVLHVDGEMIRNCKHIKEVEQQLVSGEKPSMCRLIGTSL